MHSKDNYIADSTVIRQTLGKHACTFNPYLTNGFSHHYHLSESTFNYGASGVIFKFYLVFR